MLNLGSIAELGPHWVESTVDFTADFTADGLLPPATPG
jgi:hypothetical protein